MKNRHLQFCMLAFSVVAVAACLCADPLLPTGAQVVHGQVGIETTGPGMAISQATNTAIVNWESFSIGAGNAVAVTQPSADSAMLSRVVGADPSEILGSLTANGAFFLVNPNGVYFGQDAVVDVARLVASTFDISDADFLNGNPNFTGTSSAEIANYGTITAQTVVLFAHDVRAGGSIRAGSIGLCAAGQGGQVVDFPGGGRIEFDFSDAPLPAALTGGDAVVDGVLDASGPTGGAVTIQGNRAGVFGEIHADGQTGDAGTIHVAGDEVVSLSSGSNITANGGTNGEGGVIRVASGGDIFLREGAVVEAKGGTISGDGGFIEITGSNSVEINGAINTAASNGGEGMLRIDASTLTIDISPHIGDLELVPLDAATAGDASLVTANPGVTISSDINLSATGAILNGPSSHVSLSQDIDLHGLQAVHRDCRLRLQRVGRSAPTTTFVPHGIAAEGVRRFHLDLDL